MTNRLGVILGKILPLQDTFVPKRLIQNIILLAHEVFIFLKIKRAKRDGLLSN